MVAREARLARVSAGKSVELAGARVVGVGKWQHGGMAAQWQSALQSALLSLRAPLCSDGVALCSDGGAQASKLPDGSGYVLNGSKTYITNGFMSDVVVRRRRVQRIFPRDKHTVAHPNHPPKNTRSPC